MSDPASIPQDAAAEAPDAAVLRAEWRLALLEELTEIGMELARALRPAAAAEEPGGGAESPAKGRAKDPAEAFAPLSRAIRLTLGLHAKTDQELRDLKAGIVREREEAKARPRPDHILCKLKILGLVGDVIDAEAESVEDYCRLHDAAEERLDHDEAYFDFVDRPAREVVERVCRDLGLTPDMSRWAGEGWSRDRPPPRPRFSVFNRPSRIPLLDDDGEPLETPAPPQPNGHDLQ